MRTVNPLLLVESCQQFLDKSIGAGEVIEFTMLYYDNYLHLSNKFELEIKTDHYLQKFTIDHTITE